MSNGPDPHNWFGIGSNYEQTFARVDAMIEESNLSMLGKAPWGATANGGVTGTPAIYDGVMYWSDWVGNVTAQKITDGMMIWQTKYPRGCTSSPFVDKDRVYIADRDNKVRALDRMDGKEIWMTEISDNKLAQLWSSPMVADGVVVVGLGGKGTSDGGVQYSPADLMTFRGGVVGLEATTGKIRWKWENTKGPDGMMYGPGVSSWSSAALDLKRKVAYIGTGNSYYSPASPYSDSLLALDYTTDQPGGKLIWSIQFTKNDNFTSGSPMGPDFDVGATPNLFTLDGKDYVAVGDKGGGFYIIDRDTGMLKFPRIRVSGGSSAGGVMAPASYDDGMLYVTGNTNGATSISAVDARTGMLAWTQQDASGVNFASTLLLKDVLLYSTSSGFPSGTARGSVIKALRRVDGMPVSWMLPIPNQRAGGISVYKNSLFVTYGFVFENTTAERTLTGGVLVAALGGTPVEPDPIATPPATHAPTFSAVFDEILEPRGCTAGFCHGGTGLQIEDKTKAYDNLINGTPTVGTCTTMKFIVPNNLNASFLYEKLQPSPACGAQMPKDMGMLPNEEMTQIRTWIEMGAPDN